MWLRGLVENDDNNWLYQRTIKVHWRFVAFALLELHVLSRTLDANHLGQMMYPRYSIRSRREKHFVLFNFKPEFWSFSRTASKICKIEPEIRISSMYTDTPLIRCNRFSMVRWNIEGAEETPKGKRLYLYKPVCVFTATYSSDCSSRGNWRYTCDKSNYEKYWPPAKFTSKSSIFGSG
jgi:hypothetical protein